MSRPFGKGTVGGSRGGAPRSTAAARERRRRGRRGGDALHGPGCGGARFAPSQVGSIGTLGVSGAGRGVTDPRAASPQSSAAELGVTGSRPRIEVDGRGSGVDASDCPGSLRAGCGGQVRAPRVDVWPVERAGRNSRLLPSVVLNAGGEGADGASATVLQPPPHLLTTLPAPAGGGRCGSPGRGLRGRARPGHG